MIGGALIFLAVDLSLFGANLVKVLQGGWLPLVIGVLLFTLMTTWKTGRKLVAERLTARAFPLEDFMSAVSCDPPTRVSGTAVFMTAQPKGTPPAVQGRLTELVNEAKAAGIVRKALEKLEGVRVAD